jgi:hypothetical protein
MYLQKRARGDGAMKLNKRGRIVLIYTPAALALTALLMWIAGNVWYVPGKGYCFGSMTKCYGQEFTR